MKRLLNYVLYSAILLTLTGCNVSDEGGGLTADCSEDSDCVTGVCVDGVCQAVEMDAGNNGLDADNDDMNGGLDLGADMTEPDMSDMADTGPECPEGRVDRNGDSSDGCELPTHPAATDPACEPCWNLDDAVAGCSAGECKSRRVFERQDRPRRHAHEWMRSRLRSGRVLDADHGAPE